MPADQQNADAFLSEVNLAEMAHQQALRRAQDVFLEMLEKADPNAAMYRVVAEQAADQQYQRDVARLRTKPERVDPTTNGTRT